MGGEFLRKPGDKLGLSLDLRPEPDVTRFVTAFLFDKDGVALVPASVNLTDNGGGNHTENSTTMQSVPQMRAKYRVFFDAGRTNEDVCEYLGSEDVFDRDSLTAQQLPGDSRVTGKVQGQINIKGKIIEGKVSATTKSEKLTATVQDPDLEASEKSENVSGEVNQENIKGKID